LNCPPIRRPSGHFPSHGSSVSLVAKLRAVRPGFYSAAGAMIFFSSSPHPDRLLDPPLLVPSGYLGLFLRVYSSRNV